MSTSYKNKKILVILGPTSSGKTGLAVKLALKFDGEIISADSRQVYKYMDIGTGKDLGEYEIKSKAKGQKSKVIPYHLIDIVHPNTEYNLAKFVRDANKAIQDVLDRGKLPIICGGTGLYLQALVDNFNLSQVKPNKKIRHELESLSASQLYAKLKKINKKFAEKLNDSDKKNKRRLIRYLETIGGSPIAKTKKKSVYDYLVIGLNPGKEILNKKIYKRLIERLEKEDMIGEVERLHEKYEVSWKRLSNFGLEYKYVSLYLQDKLNHEEMVEKLFIAIRQFAKRQMTWFRRWEKQGREIVWYQNDKEALKKIKFKDFK